MSASAVLVIVGIAFMFIGWALGTEPYSTVMFIVGLVLAIVGILGSILRRF